MRFLQLILCAAFATTAAIAIPPSEENAERMLIVLQTEKHHQERLAALDALNRHSFTERIGRGMPLTAEQRETVETAVATASQIVRTELAWTRIKPDLIRIIQETYDDEELSSILRLYATAADNALPLKFFSVEERLAKYMLDRMNAAGPMIQAGIEGDLRELRRSQLDTTIDPLSQLIGDWVITTFLFGGGHSGISACGLDHQPARITSPSKGTIEASAVCRDGSQYVFKLVRGNEHRSYLLTVNNTEGINIRDFPIKYLGSAGWMGTAQQLVDDKEISLSAAITPIEGKTWYGWAIGIRPTAEAGVDYNKTRTPYLKVDFIQRK
jgi:hypothetical protein